MYQIKKKVIHSTNSIFSKPLRDSGIEKRTKTGVENRHLCYHIPSGKVATALAEH